MTHPMHAARDARLLQIAQTQLLLQTLETRGRDNLDFSDQSVCCIKAALEDAYAAGHAAAKRGHKLAVEQIESWREMADARGYGK